MQDYHLTIKRPDPYVPPDPKLKAKAVEENNKELLIEWYLQREEWERQEKAWLGATNLYKFNQKIMKWPDIYEELHKPVCDFIQENIWTKWILLMLPRGTFKSSVVTVGGSCWLIARDPSIRIYLTNGTRDMAVSFLSQIKKHVKGNEDYIKYYGDMSANADTWREDRFAVSYDKSYEAKDPTIIATGIATNAVGSHFDVGIMDDPVTRENSGTGDQREKVKQSFKDTLDLIDPLPNGHKPLIIVGTAWDDGDLYSWIQDPESGLSDKFAILKLPAYEGEWGKGKLLFPTRLSWNVLDTLKKAQGPSHFASQYMLDPVPPENAKFKTFKYYEKSDIAGLPMNIFMSLDSAVSEKRSADYSALDVVGVDFLNDWYILDLWKGQVGPNELIQKIIDFVQKWRPITLAVEKTAAYLALRPFLYEKAKQLNVKLYITELVHNERSKQDRILGLEPRYANGDILHNREVPFIKDLEEELKRFPRSRHDDISDALANLLEIAYPSRNRQRRDEWDSGPVTVRRSGNYPA